MTRHVAAARRLIAVALFACLFAAAAPAQVDPLQPARDRLAEARRLYEELEWERAAPVLDEVVAALRARPAADQNVALLLATAYELRARTRFGLGDREGARQDLAALVALAPSYTMPENVAAAVLQMFDEVKRASVATLLLSVEPSDALVSIDGLPLSDTATAIDVTAGTRTISATRGGYRPFEQQVTVIAGTQVPVTVALERIASRVAVITSPPGVEVTLDGVVQGTTPPGPVPDRYADAAQRLGLPPEKVSAPFFVDDVPTGVRLFEFKRPCYQTLDSRRLIERPADLLLEVALTLAAATVRVESNVPGADVLLDGEPKGTAPLVLSEVCEGPRVLEVTSPTGRFIHRFEARAGETLEIHADLAPALALVSLGGDEVRFRGEDVRLLVERLFEPARSLTVFVPPAEGVADALREQHLPIDWLAVDSSGRPANGLTAISANLRRDASAQLARRFGAQGVAGIHLLPGGDGRAVVSLLAAGASDPDVMEVSLASPLPPEALRALDATAEVQAPSLDFVGVEIADNPGVAIVSVLAGGQAVQAGLVPGDLVVDVRDVPVRSMAELAAAIAALPPGQAVPVTVKDRAGATRTVMAAPVRRPVLVSVEDRMTGFNRLALDLRFRLTGVTDPAEETLLRLNLAVALLKLGNHAEARRELARVKLPDGPGISNGTVQYLVGLSYEGTNQPAEAEQAFRAAAAVEGAQLTVFGPAIADLVKARASRR